uniref:Ig-like domain-containing protein n=1 Tax=Acanthochromis polyacanthus TaxID=80966 RepID=A0A3Q1FLB5_9TELE
AMAPSESVVSMVGGDAVLPCRLEAGLDAAQVTVEWGRPDLEPRFVYIWHNGKELTNNQNAAYKGRASMSADELKQGNGSLKLTQLKISDNGRYRCYIPKHDEEYFVELLVGDTFYYNFNTHCIMIFIMTVSNFDATYYSVTSIQEDSL